MASREYLKTTPGTQIEFRTQPGRLAIWSWRLRYPLTAWREARPCRVYWGHAGCVRRRGHRGRHHDQRGHARFDPAYAFGEDWHDEP